MDGSTLSQKSYNEMLILDLMLIFDAGSFVLCHEVYEHISLVGGSLSCAIRYPGIAFLWASATARTIISEADAENTSVKIVFWPNSQWAWLVVFFQPSMTENRSCLPQTLVITALLSHLKVWALGPAPHSHHMDWLCLDVLLLGNIFSLSTCWGWQWKSLFSAFLQNESLDLVFSRHTSKRMMLS